LVAVKSDTIYCDGHRRWLMSKTSYLPTARFHAPKSQLRRLQHALDAGARVVVETPGGERVTSDELSRLLQVALEDLASGAEVVVLRGEAEVSPAEAGELLGLSRQFVDRLIDQGDIPAQHLPGSRHRRLRLGDVIAFQQRREQRRATISSAVNELVDAGAKY
jgi:excisionase family DNA binding protein